MSILQVLQKELDRIEQDEQIDGTCPASLTDAIDLEVAGVPLVVPSRCDDWQWNPPEPARYEKWGDRWAIVYPKNHDFEYPCERNLKLMRARFLLMNGWYYRHFYTLAHSTQQQVMHLFLQHTQGQPPSPDSPMGKILGIDGGGETIEAESRK